VATELNAEAGWNFRATWLIFMLLPAVLTALAGYFGVKFGTIGVLYLAYLAVKHPALVRDMEEVFD
jgi:hypothetical protein